MNDRMLGFCVGVGFGLGFGILMAPRSGERIRSLIRSKVADGNAHIKRTGLEIRNQASELTRKSTAAVLQRSEAARAAVQAGKKAYSKAVNA